MPSSGGADLLGRDEAVREVTAVAVRAVTARARRLEDRPAAIGKRVVDRKRIGGSIEAGNPRADVGEIRVDGARLVYRARAEDRRRHHDACMIPASAADVEHRRLLLHVPPRRHVDGHVDRRRHVHQRRRAPGHRLRIVMGEEHGRESVGRVRPARAEHRVGSDGIDALLPLRPLRTLLGIGEERADEARGLNLRGGVVREIAVGRAEPDDQLAVDAAGMTREAVGRDEVDAVLRRHRGEVVGEVRVLALATRDRVLGRHRRIDLGVRGERDAAWHVRLVDERAVPLGSVTVALRLAVDRDHRIRLGSRTSLRAAVRATGGRRDGLVLVRRARRRRRCEHDRRRHETGQGLHEHGSSRGMEASPPRWRGDHWLARAPEHARVDPTIRLTNRHVSWAFLRHTTLAHISQIGP